MAPDFARTTVRNEDMPLQELARHSRHKVAKLLRLQEAHLLAASSSSCFLTSASARFLDIPCSCISRICLHANIRDGCGAKEFSWMGCNFACTADHT